MGLRDRIEAMEPREQKLLAVLVAVFAAMTVLLIPIGVVTMLAQRQSENEELQAAIDELYAQRDKIQQGKAQRQQVLDRYAKEAPALAGFLTKLADASEIEIPEIKDRPPVPIGKDYEERSTGISLKQVGMLNLAKFLERIAQAPHPVSISKLNIKKRPNPPDQYDVQMTVSAYHRLATGKKKSGAPEADSDEEEPSSDDTEEDEE